jgi:uncharacterized membrane protein
MDLKKVNGVVIEIDTTPNQRFVSTNGSYTLNVPNGEYTITAKYSNTDSQQSTKELITIKQDGDYVLDLFLFIDLSEGGLKLAVKINPQELPVEPEPGVLKIIGHTMDDSPLPLTKEFIKMVWRNNQVIGCSFVPSPA